MFIASFFTAMFAERGESTGVRFVPLAQDAPLSRWEAWTTPASLSRLRSMLEIAVIGALVLALAFGATLALNPSLFAPVRSVNDDAAAIRSLAQLAAGETTPPLDPVVVPAVAPVDYFAVRADVARAVNASIPFSTAPIVPARPFILMAPPDEHERALTCLAAAVYYEAGNDPAGQAAVAQVVLNRVRHPAFPKTVCGVVFQGASRVTGCQFTFACDGSIAARVPSPAVWAGARATAERALTGGVFVVVGVATHYHTEFVLPRWSPQMDKIASYHGHLFFRWRGAWGQLPAFRGVYAGPELLDPRLLRLANSAALQSTATVGMASETIPMGFTMPDKAPIRPMIAVPGVGAVPVSGTLKLTDEAKHIYFVHFDGNEYPGTYAVTAWKLCAGKSPCTVYGWRKAEDMPRTITTAIPSTVSFTFHKGDSGRQSSLWNCRQVTRENPAQCLPGTSAVAANPASAPPAKPPAALPKTPAMPSTR